MIAFDSLLRGAGRTILDFALPPRCGGCGTIVAEPHSFCGDCWAKIDFLGEGGCTICGLPMTVATPGPCGACQAKPPPVVRARAAVAYGDISRSLALRLKYGRKVALARTMARYMRPFVGDPAGAMLVPVPLHRRRIAVRGFNQSLLIARELSRLTGAPVAPTAIRRTRHTAPLKGLHGAARRRMVAGAFDAGPRGTIAGGRFILIDDVMTTGATAFACAKALRRAGADQVELISWARVVRPTQFAR